MAAASTIMAMARWFHLMLSGPSTCLCPTTHVDRPLRDFTRAIRRRFLQFCYVTVLQERAQPSIIMGDIIRCGGSQWLFTAVL